LKKTKSFSFLRASSETGKGESGRREGEDQQLTGADPACKGEETLDFQTSLSFRKREYKLFSGRGKGVLMSFRKKASYADARKKIFPLEERVHRGTRGKTFKGSIRKKKMVPHEKKRENSRATPF